MMEAVSGSRDGQFGGAPLGGQGVGAWGVGGLRQRSLKPTEAAL